MSLPVRGRIHHVASVVRDIDASIDFHTRVLGLAEGFHHLCLEVPDIAAELTGLAAAGVQLINAEAVTGVEGPVAFLHPKSCNGVLIELIEAPGGPAWNRLGFGAAGELRIR